jgi:hypothetical protein
LWGEVMIDEQLFEIIDAIDSDDTIRKSKYKEKWTLLDVFDNDFDDGYPERDFVPLRFADGTYKTYVPTTPRRQLS